MHVSVSQALVSPKHRFSKVFQGFFCSWKGEVSSASLLEMGQAEEVTFSPCAELLEM